MRKERANAALMVQAQEGTRDDMFLSRDFWLILQVHWHGHPLSPDWNLPPKHQAHFPSDPQWSLERNFNVSCARWRLAADSTEGVACWKRGVPMVGWTPWELQAARCLSHHGVVQLGSVGATPDIACDLFLSLCISDLETGQWVCGQVACSSMKREQVSKHWWVHSVNARVSINGYIVLMYKT